MERLCQGVDVIFHQAAIASVQRSIDEPMNTWDINVNGTATVIAAAIKSGVRRVIFASSSAVYGEAQNLPSSETDRFDPLSPYASHKLSGELMLHNAWQNGQLETVALRYFNVFGPRQSADSPYSGAIVTFARAMLREGGHGPVRIFGDGAQTRDFVFIADVVQANLAAMDASADQVAGLSFNIGSGAAHSILQTAQTLAHFTAYKGAFQHDPPRAAEVPHSLADIRLACIRLGFRPAISFGHGLAETVAWMRSTALAETQPAPVVPAFPYKPSPEQTPVPLF